MSAPIVGSPEWRGLVTASKAAAIIGVSPWESPYSLWMTMKGRYEREQTTAMARGNYLEPAILAWWRDQHAELADHALRSQDWAPFEDWAGATVDMSISPLAPEVEGEVGRKILPPTAIVEAKSAARMDEWGRPGTDEIPAYYLAQVYFQLAVTGAARCYVPVIGPYLDFSEYVVEADAAFQADIIARCRAFYETLTADEPPELDSSVATYDVVRKSHPDIEAKKTVDLDYLSAAEYIEASAEFKAAESRERLAKARLLETMGRANYADCNGVRVARRQPNKYGISLVNVAKSTTALTEGTAA